MLQNTLDTYWTAIYPIKSISDNAEEYLSDPTIQKEQNIKIDKIHSSNSIIYKGYTIIDVSITGDEIKCIWEYQPEKSLFLFHLNNNLKELSQYKETVESQFPTSLEFKPVSPTYEQIWKFVPTITQKYENVTISTTKTQQTNVFSIKNNVPIQKISSNGKNGKKIQYEPSNMLKIPRDGKQRQKVINKFDNIILS